MRTKVDLLVERIGLEGLSDTWEESLAVEHKLRRADGLQFAYPRWPM